LSLRSTGVTILDEKQDIVDYIVVSNPEAGEELIVKNSDDILAFLLKYHPKTINLEGLSFGSKSSSKDIIAGNFWYLRVKIRELLPESELKVVAVSSWRKYVIPKELAAQLKKENKQPKGWQKVVCVDRLPQNVRVLFDEYLKTNRPPKATSKMPLYDLTDSYFLALHSFR